MKQHKKIRNGLLGALTALALAFGFAAPANAAVTPTFGNLKVSGATSVKLSTSTSAKKTSFKVTFDGPAANSDRSYYGFYSDYSSPKVEYLTKNKGVKNVNKPYLDSPATGSLTPASAATFTFSTYKYTTPGKYRLTFPIWQRTWNGSGYVNSVKTVTKLVTVKAHSKTSKTQTSLNGSARANKKFPLTVTAPDYQYGAKVTVYYKAKGSKKYKKVATGKLNKRQGSYASKTKINISKKYNLGGKGGSIYVKVAKVSNYAPAYKSATAKLRRY